MDERFFDNLAKGLDDGTVSRDQVLKLVGSALLAVVFPPLFPRHADASSKARRRCRRRGASTYRREIVIAQARALHLCQTFAAITIRIAFAHRP